MKKRSAGAIVARTFLKSIGIIAIFIALGVLSYYLTMLYYNKTERTERSTQYTHVISVNTGNESSNLIYSYDKEKQKIDAIVLELFDETTKNMNYITIPVESRITVSGDSYSKIIKVNQDVPQVIKIADILKYFSGDVAYEYGVMILQDALRSEIGYFTMMPSDKFHQYFRELDKKELTYYPSDALLDAAGKCTDKSSMDEFIESKWDELVTDITLGQKQHYSEALSQVNRSYIRGYRAEGKKSGKGFLLNANKNRKLINSIWESDAYTYAQPELGAGSSGGTGGGDKKLQKILAAMGRSIQITNGTGIDGLAAAYQKKLEADGLKVIGVGNYYGGIQTTTTIFAGKRKWAKALKVYFKKPAIQVADNLTNNADIEIVLGTKDALKQ